MQGQAASLLVTKTRRPTRNIDYSFALGRYYRLNERIRGETIIGYGQGTTNDTISFHYGYDEYNEFIVNADYSKLYIQQSVALMQDKGQSIGIAFRANRIDYSNFFYSREPDSGRIETQTMDSTHVFSPVQGSLDFSAFYRRDIGKSFYSLHFGYTPNLSGKIFPEYNKLIMHFSIGLNLGGTLKEKGPISNI